MSREARNPARGARAQAALGAALLGLMVFLLVRGDHGRVGAYLMGLWGLSDGIVEALAYHHTPRECDYAGLSTLAIVHAADALLHEALGTAAMEDELDIA